MVSNFKKERKHILVESELHAPFKSYCNSIENKPVKTVISNMIQSKLLDSGFKVISHAKAECLRSHKEK